MTDTQPPTTEARMAETRETTVTDANHDDAEVPIFWLTKWNDDRHPSSICCSQEAADFWLNKRAKDQGEIIPVVPKSAYDDLAQQFAAANAAREQAEAACAAFREAITSKHDTPSSLIEGLQAYAMRTHNAEKAWHTTIADKLEAALASDDGKSAADELVRLRRIADAAVRKHKQSMLADADAIYDIAALELDDAIADHLRVIEATQPTRAERSDSASRSEA